MNCAVCKNQALVTLEYHAVASDAKEYGWTKESLSLYWARKANNLWITLRRKRVAHAQFA
jgi:hypothetical protein